MESMAVGGLLVSTTKDVDRLFDIRAEKRENLRGRNRTSCRSPTRELDTKQMKNKRKEKRHLEFQRRRSVSPKSCGKTSANLSTTTNLSPDPNFIRPHSSSSKATTLHENTQNIFSGNGHTKMILTPSNSETVEAPGTSAWASLQADQIRKQSSTSTAEESHQYSTKGRSQKDSRINGTKTNIKTENNTNPSKQNKIIFQKNILENTSMRTEPGFVLVRESDLEMLGNYLQEALLREELLKEKLASLQENTSTLLNSSDRVWTSRFREDQLNSKISTLEAQLQAYLQRLSKDGVKKTTLDEEQQRLDYEEQALKALQKATEEKAEALSRAESLQEALVMQRAEALRWRALYEELKMNSGQHQFTDEQLQQLQSQVELTKDEEDELREEVSSLKHERRELQYKICQLQEDKQTLTEEIQKLKDGSDQTQDSILQEYLLSETAECPFTVSRESQLKEQLRVSEEKLQLKEKECAELQMGLDAMEQECVSTQARLSQCRDELRQLSHRRSRTRMQRGSWWKVFAVVLLLLSLAMVAMLWFCHPPFREQVEDFYSDIGTRIENYLMEMASSQHAGCFRPI